MPSELLTAPHVRQARLFTRPRLIALLWVCAVIAVVVMVCTGPVGWDAKVYWKAIQSVHRGSDPYAESILARQAFHARPAGSNPTERPPFVYAYSPITLPLLRLLGVFPGWTLGLLYGAAIAAGALAQLWTGFQMADNDERRWLALVLPSIIFFPGLITDDVILSGNVAWVLYGMILAAAVPGWKRGSWTWYYLAVLAASICKAPLLSLLAFPVLVDRRQWIPSCVTAMAGVLTFAAPTLLWPHLFQEYLLTLRLMFDGGQDFGFGPAGILGRFLWRRGLPGSPATTILYLAFAGVLGIVLLILARHVRQWNLPQERWIPVALLGTLLLNPRIMKYDQAAITIPMLLIGWRALRFASRHSAASGGRRRLSLPAAILIGAGSFLIPNILTVIGPSWVPVELALMLAILAAGFWLLVRDQRLKHPAFFSSTYIATSNSGAGQSRPER